MKRIVSITLWGLCLANANAQSSTVLNAAGGSATIGSNYYDFNIGEMVLVQQFTLPGAELTQGFLQPFFLRVRPEEPDGELMPENNVISPNGDGKNDFLVIRGLEKYPGTTLNLYDRAGRVVYSTVDYKNDFDGRIGGMVLNEDTYYYVIYVARNRRIKGFVTVIWDKQ